MSNALAETPEEIQANGTHIFICARKKQKKSWIDAAIADGRSLSSWVRHHLDRAAKEVPVK